MFTINLKRTSTTSSAASGVRVQAAALRDRPGADGAGRRVAEVEKQNEAKVLDRPRPFTQNALARARRDKDRMTAVVFLKDITAKYLEPYEFGGKNVSTAGRC
jgi:hypothetical protein